MPPETPAVIALVNCKSAAATVMLADAVFPVPPFVEVTAPLVLFLTPPVVPITVTATVQELLIAMVPPVREMRPLAGAAVATPPHVLLSPFGLATTKPEGNVSLKATPVSATVLAAGLVRVNVRLVVPLSGMLAAPNALPIVGGATTAMLALAVTPLSPSVDVTLPLVLVCDPAAVPVTFTMNVHVPLAASDAPDKLMTLVFCVAVRAPPPQEPLKPFGVEIMSPDRRVSLKPMPFSVVLKFGFWMVKLRLVDPPSGMLAAPNALLIAGGATTRIPALPVPPLDPASPAQLAVYVNVFTVGADAIKNVPL